MVFSLGFLLVLPGLTGLAKGAASAASSASRSSSFSSSSRSVSTPKPSLKKTETTSSLSKSNSSFTNDSKSTKPTTTGNPNSKEEDKNKVDLSKRKYTGMTNKGSYVKPENMPTSKIEYYREKPYYNPSTGFATGLLVGGGVMLVLDHLSNDGDPVYTNADTGAVANPDEYGNDIQNVGDDIQSTQENNSSDGRVFVFAFFIIVILGLLVLIFINIKK